MKLVYPSVLLVAILGTLPEDLAAQPPRMAAETSVKDGLSINEPGALDGYTLIFPLRDTSTYLVDMESRIVNEWKSTFTPAHSAYLMPNGDLVRPGAESGFGPTSGGRVQRFNWDGELVWDFSIKSLDRDLQPHHDIHPMPNGNVLMIAYVVKSPEEAETVGRPTDGGRIQADCILEIKPTGENSGEVVWEWHAWDHLIQDVNESRPGYGDVSEHPERIDVNFGNDAFEKMMQDPEAVARLRSLGYVGGGTPRPGDNASDQPTDGDQAADGNAGQDPPDGDRGRGRRDGGGPGRDPNRAADWLHINAIDYNAELDQIMLSVHGFSEIWIIDHSTSTEEAATHAGGMYGKGGDLLYRWGNPQAYRNGSNVDRRLYQQHNAHWIPKGLPGAGNVLVFNNGSRRPDGSYSSVDELVLPVNTDGSYEREEFAAFGPDQPTWSYTAEDKSTFFSHFISGAHRLPNGNTLICSGAQGIVFEVTPDKKTVWQYKHPVGEGDRGQGRGPDGFAGFEMPRPGEILPEFLQGMLQLSDEQKQSVAQLQKEVDAKLQEVLTDAQRDQLAEMPERARQAFGRGDPPGAGPPGFGPGGPPPGDAARDRRPAGTAQARGEGPGRDRDQRDRDRGRGGPGGGGRDGGPGGPFRLSMGVAGGRGGGPGGLFRSYRYAADYPAFAGKTLTPGEELLSVVAARVQAGRDDRPQRPDPQE